MKRFFFIFAILLMTPAWAQEDPSSWGQPQNEYLITTSKLYISPERVIPNGRLYVKDGVIKAAGTEISAPAGVRTVDFSDRVVHAAFLDPYVAAKEVGLKETPATPVSGSYPKVHDDFLVAENLNLKDDALKVYRKQGFAVVAVAPGQGIFRGQSAVYKTASSDQDSELLLTPSAYSVLAFEQGGWGELKGENYPLSMMGNVALIRQTFLDCDWYAKWREDPALGTMRPDYQGALESLRAVKLGRRPLFLQADDYLETLRLFAVTKEIGLTNTVVVLSGQEWKNLDWFKSAAGGKFVLPLDFPETVKTKEGISEEQLSLDVLREWYAAPANARWLREKGVRFSLTTHGLKSPDKLEQRIQEAVAAGLSKEAALGGLTTEPAGLLGLSQYGSLEPGKSASFVVRRGDLFSGESSIEEVWIDGKRYPDFKQVALGEAPEPDKVKPRDFVKEADYSKPPEHRAEVFAPGSVLVKGATLWTQDKGTVTGDLLVQGGKIVSVGQSSGPAAHVIDGSGLHVTPGIVDAHSHTAVDGMVNEPGKNITAMVRMKDVLNPFDHEVYLQLASGVTAANILHGSANAIGGQSITCKWRWGEPPSRMVMEGAPEGIKFALGENPKQSNWGDDHTTRYPQSRMGVVELIRGAFISARNYQKLKKEGKDPKPDLMLDALVDVLEGRRIVHCHSYRQDEILALIRAADEVGFKVNVFQHVLEGYKVTEAMKEHGATASTFADWWAYKVEVEDAIPHNASLMTEAGVMTSINSDSNDLARRLNTEAAKSMRYGGLSAEQCMDLITKNPAIQLGVGDRIGTLTAGKDADFVIWSDDPLSQNAVVLQTWIDGKRYFDRTLESQRVDELVKQRAAYLKLLEEKKKK